MELKSTDICIMRIVEGSLTDKSCIQNFPQKVLQVFDDDPNWGRLVEVTLPFARLKEVQRFMIKHYEGPEPWYMDGRLATDIDTVICAFGADDGEGGKTFVFKRDDTKAFQQVFNYAISKGIPKEQIDFL